MTKQELWEQRARAAGAEVAAAADWEDAAAYVAALVRPGRRDLLTGAPVDGASVAAPGLPAPFREALARRLPGDAKLLENGLRAHAGGLDVGVATARAAVADTGSCLLDGTDEDARLATMLPDVSVLLLPLDADASSVLPDLAAADALVRNMLDGDAPRHLTFITGPSRTADIERALTLGVHGPLELHVLLVPPALLHD